MRTEDVDSGLALSAYVGADLNENVGIRGTVGYFEADAEERPLVEGDFSTLFITAGLRFAL